MQNDQNTVHHRNYNQEEASPTIVAERTWVSTCDTPSMALSLARKSASGANPDSSQAPKSAKGTVVMSLKSKHAPQTRRFTVAFLDAFLISGRYSSTTLEMASSDLESLLSPVYLHRHSRQTLSKDMAPFARSTFNATDGRLTEEVLGAKACTWNHG